MDLDLVFLGTAASVPTHSRGLSAALIRRGGDRLLLDCGEGTQRQLMRSCGLVELAGVYVTHLHADHVLGLPGMLKTFGLRERTAPLRVHGPRGIRAFFSMMKPVVGRLPFELDVIEVEDGWEQDHDGFRMCAFQTQHSVRSVGWSLVEDERPGRFDIAAARELGVPDGPLLGELHRGRDVTLDDGTVVTSAGLVSDARPGRTLVYTGDTAACAAVREAATDAELLVHESTFTSADADRARQTGHATALDAALTAAAADVGMLALTHVSTRYRPRELSEEARTVFPDTIVARDFDVIEIPYPERGAPVHHRGAARDTAAPAAVEGSPA